MPKLPHPLSRLAVAAVLAGAAGSAALAASPDLSLCAFTKTLTANRADPFSRYKGAVDDPGINLYDGVLAPRGGQDCSAFLGARMADRNDSLRPYYVCDLKKASADQAVKAVRTAMAELRRCYPGLTFSPVKAANGPCAGDVCDQEAKIPGFTLELSYRPSSLADPDGAQSVAYYIHQDK